MPTPFYLIVCSDPYYSWQEAKNYKLNHLTWAHCKDLNDVQECTLHIRRYKGVVWDYLSDDTIRQFCRVMQFEYIDKNEQHQITSGTVSSLF